MKNTPDLDGAKPVSIPYNVSVDRGNLLNYMRRMIDWATESDVAGEFNGVEFLIPKGTKTTVEELELYYGDKLREAKGISEFEPIEYGWKTFDTKALGNTIQERISKVLRDVSDFGKQFHIRTEFNGIELLVLQGSNPTSEELEVYYFNELRKIADAEGVAEKERLVKSQKIVDMLVERLEELDFGNWEKVLEWILNWQRATYHNGTSYNNEAIMHTFSNHGFLAGGDISKLNINDLQIEAKNLFLKQGGDLSSMDAV